METCLHFRGAALNARETGIYESRFEYQNQLIPPSRATTRTASGTIALAYGCRETFGSESSQFSPCRIGSILKPAVQVDSVSA